MLLRPRADQSFEEKRAVGAESKVEVIGVELQTVCSNPELFENSSEMKKS